MQPSAREKEFAPALLLAAPQPLPADFPACLERALQGGEVAGVIVDASGVEAQARLSLLAECVTRCHQHGAALFLLEEPALVIQTGADGVLLRSAEGLEAARRLLGLERPIGVIIARSRHAAMEAGEAGADWLLLGEEEPFARRLALVRWWSGLFVLPCAARCETPAEAAALLEAGSDFLIPPVAIWHHPEAALAAYRGLLGPPRPTRAAC